MTTRKAPLQRPRATAVQARIGDAHADPIPIRFPAKHAKAVPQVIARLPTGMRDTPLIPIGPATHRLNDTARMFIKAEYLNRAGSAKGRPAFYMVDAAIESGRLNTTKQAVAPTSGNTGVSLAEMTAQRGIPITLVMPDNASVERIALGRWLGAQVKLTPARLGSDGAYAAAREMVAANPDHLVLIDQYTDEANVLAHFETTGPEIWEQTKGRVTILVAAVGTGGTITGTGRYLKGRNPAVRVIAVEPASDAERIPGLRNYHGTRDAVPAIFDPAVVDGFVGVTAADAWAAARRCARTAGLMVGPSSGAVVHALSRIELVAADVVVAIAPDGIEKYVSELGSWSGEDATSSWPRSS